MLILNSCGTSINLSQFQPVSVFKSKYAPSKQKLQATSQPKVLIRKFSNGSIKLAKKSSLAKSLKSTLTSKLSESKLVTIVRRDKKTSIKKEIEAKELAIQTGIDVGESDYIISGAVTNVTYNYSFTEGKVYEIKGVKIPISPKFDYQACVSGVIHIFSLPGMNEEQSISFNNCATNSEDVANGNATPRRRDYGLVRQAGQEGIIDASYKLKNFFAKKGYIYEVRQNRDSELILKTTLGKRQGAEEGVQVEIFTIKESFNPLTEQKELEEFKIGSGVISNQIKDNFSWIKVRTLNKNEEIMIGDFIKPKYKRSFF